MGKRTDSPGRGSLVGAALTAASLLVMTVFSAAVGVLIAREFGRDDVTDGFLAAYGVFVVLVLAAQAIRVAVIPELSRARADRRLAGELTGLCIAIATVAVPLVLVAELAAGPIGGLLTGGESQTARETAADALRWMVPAAAAQLFAGAAASALAAFDDYATAALGYAVGSAAAFAVILARVDEDGIQAIAWGMAVNGIVSLAIPVAGLAWRARTTRMPRSAMRPAGAPVRLRLAMFAAAAALPLALQLLYVACLPFAGRVGEGAVTSFGYAYLAGAALVAITASSLGLVSSAPLARAGIGAEQAARHVVASAWVALAFVAATAAVFAAAGGQLVELALGDAYGGEVGAEVGELVVALSPWMVASVGVTLTFPLAFVAGRERALPWVALAALALHLPVTWLLWSAFDLFGLAVALAISTAAVLAALLARMGALRRAAPGLAVAAATLAVAAGVAFVPPSFLLDPVATAVLGVALYVTVLAVLRPQGLAAGWRYLRALS